MSVHAVVIGTTRDDAVAWVGQTPWLEWSDIEWISPRSPDRCRGITADVVLATPAACRLSTTALQRLREVAMPCIQSSVGHGEPS